jgi:DNA-binding SARP family transcriptional activator
VKALDQAITTAERTGIHLWDAMLFANMVYCNLTQGKYEQASNYLGKMSFVLHTSRNMDISHYHFLRAFESLALGKLQLAQQHIHAGMKFSSDAGVPYIYNFYITSLADILIEQGDFEEAMPYLEEARTFGWAMKSHDLEYQYCWLTALIALKLNDRKTAHENLRHYLRISRECRIVNHAWWRPSVMTRLLGEALEAGIENAHVKDLIKLHGLVPTESQMHLENWPWPVKIFTFGQFRLELDGKAVIFGGKTPKKPLELLKAIIALGGRDVSEERIIDALWPEAPGDLAFKSFEMALQRLRRLIGSDKAIRRQEGMLTLDERYCWTDVWTFEKLVQDAEHPSSSPLPSGERIKVRGKSAIHNSQSKIMQRLEKAIRLYQGHFLPTDARQSWSALTRERLRSKFLRLVVKTGEEYERQGEWKKAVECFERGLERDAVCEEFYQHLMICHNKLGHRSEAVKAYQRCRAALRDGLGLDPSLHTEEIHSSLLRNG